MTEVERALEVALGYEAAGHLGAGLAHLDDVLRSVGAEGDGPDDTIEVLRCRLTRAGLRRVAGQAEGATRDASRVAAGAEAIGAGALVAEAWRLLGRLSALGRRWKRAGESFDRAAAARQGLGLDARWPDLALDRAALALEARDLEAIGALLAGVDGSARRSLIEGQAALAGGEVARARPALEAALAAAGEPATWSEREVVCFVRHGLGACDLAEGRFAEALEHLAVAEAAIGAVAAGMPEDLRRSFLARDDLRDVLVDLQVARAALRREDPSVEGVGRLVAERNRLLRFETVARALASEHDLDRLLEVIIDVAIESTEAERGFLVLIEDGKARFKVARNIDREEVHRPGFKVSNSILRQVAETGRAVLTNHAGFDPEHRDRESVRQLDLASLICVPLVHAGGTIGVLYLDHRFREGVFGREDLQFLETVARQAALAVENVRLLAALEEKNRQLEKKVGTQRLRLADLQRQLSGVARRDVPIVTRSPLMEAVLRQVERVAGNDFPVLIEGDSGTGKELLARAIHQSSGRAGAPFVSENCGGLPENLLESVLFGHRKGAFTGADADRVGLFEAADGGTLFLDEIGELSLEAQKRLLRALQEGEFRPVGSTKVLRVDVRVLAATHRNLQAMVEDGEFREDLYYRLNVIHLEVPPLRARPEDIEILARTFLDDLSGDGPSPSLEPAALDALRAYGWPGNVRELKNEVQRWVTFAGDVIGRADLSPRVLEPGGSPAARSTGGAIEVEGKTLKDIEKRAIEIVLAATGGNKKRTAEILSISRRALYDKIKALGVGVGDA